MRDSPPRSGLTARRPAPRRLISSWALEVCRMNRRESIENAIEAGLLTAAKGMHEIWKDKLYRELYPTFDEYAKHSWGMTKPTAYRLMGKVDESIGQYKRPPILDKPDPGALNGFNSNSLDSQANPSDHKRPQGRPKKSSFTSTEKSGRSPRTWSSSGKRLTLSVRNWRERSIIWWR